jgi:hypothetical protein
MTTPHYEQVTPESFGGDRVAAEIARNNMRRVEGNKLVHPPVRYQAALREINAAKESYAAGGARPDWLGAQF